MKKSILLLVCIAILGGLCFASSKVRVMVNGKPKMLEREYEEEYDSNGNLIKKIDSYGSETKYEYNKSNKVSKKIKNNGNEVLYFYDNKGRLVRVEDGWDITYYGYDNDGHKIYKGSIPMDNPYFTENEGSQWKYDSKGNLIQSHEIYGDTYYYTYDDDNKLISMEKKGYWDTSKATYQYEDGNLIYVEDPNNVDGGTRMMTYDANGNMDYKWINDHEYYYEYDEHNNVTKVTDEDEDVVDEYTYKYNDDGEIIYYQYKNRNGVQKEYSINEFGKYDYLYDYTNNEYISERYEYDEDGLRTKVTSPYDGTTYIDSEYIYVYEKNADGKVTKKGKYLSETSGK